ncbi:MAG: DUF262 domain-containing protein [Ruminiclostridium sp.]|nr:DUF262 domain-containing protein [Ruminiclostridium sp.]
MSEQIKHGFIAVKDLFTDKWYKIPEYQRPYVWGKEQASDLLDDIMKEAYKLKELQKFDESANREYFLGSLVWKTTKCNDGTSSYEEFEVLDGQQRLTTMLLIHAVIRDLTNNEKRKDNCKDAIFQEADPDNGIPERLRVIFGIRGNVQEFVNTYIKQENGTMKTDELSRIQKNNSDVNCSHMAEVILAIHEYFEDDTQDKIDTFYGFFRIHTKLIYISSTELEDAFHLFNVMNNRGIKLRNSDILKAKNLAQIQNDITRQDYASKWELTENYFGEDYDQFLEFIRLCLVKRKAAVSLLKEFEDNIYHPTEYDRNTKETKKLAPILTEGANTLDCINNYFAIYQKVFDNKTYSTEVLNLLKAMERGFEADFWKAPVLHYVKKFSDSELESFLNALNRKFTADWVDELYFTKRIENVCRIIDAIDQSKTADNVLRSDAFNYDKGLTLKQLDSPVYGKKYCRYLLLLVSVIFSGNETPMNLPEIISIEHILPQNPEAGSQWSKDFTDSQREDCTNKLGNLMLISRRKNSSLSNYDFTSKKERYFSANVGSFPLSFKIYGNYQTWTYDDYKKNHNDVLSKLKQYFEL